MTIATDDTPDRATVLVVDDERDILVALQDLLEDEYAVLVAVSAEEGLRLLAAHPDVAVIISDQRMPGMTGERFLAAARAFSDAGAILLTGYADLSAVADAINKGGITGYVPKPWDAAALTAMVRAAAERCLIGRALAVERSLLHGLLESSRDAVSFKDPQGRFVRLNARKAALLGAEPATCLGRTEAEIRGCDPGDGAAADRTAIESGAHSETVSETAESDGRSVWTETSRTPIPGRDGRTAYLMTVERDITENRFIEARLRQSEKMQALGTLAGGIAHDFNNLLTAIIGSLDLAERRLPEDERLKRYVTGARQAAERGAVLTKRLLGFSRQRERKQEQTDVNGLVARMKDLLDHALGGTVTVAWSLMARPATVMVDAEQLELAILNLCVNARDAMPDGGTVRIATGNQSVAEGNPEQLEPGPYVTISVEDSGSGIAPDVLARVFEPFFTTKDVGKGTGLGLSMVYTLANQAGGDVRLDSAVGEGTTVTLRLPLSEARMEAVAENRAAAPQKVRPARVLVVDDDPAVRAVTAAYGTTIGHQIQEADGGPAALALIEAGEPFDVMVVDYAMPGMNGVELAERIRALRPGLPIVFVTGHAEADALDAMERYLPKPFRQEDLQAAIAAALPAVPAGTTGRRHRVGV
ncbi:response regulator [Chthonobacter albigriseus]|uniref:response regulator n=1 Tax=Chthonobacter albigriseus TaxID=1683161 RepID=UPI0015EF98F9|nr:response regulator [Chthonobacter albigriseus]